MVHTRRRAKRKFLIILSISVQEAHVTALEGSYCGELTALDIGRAAPVEPPRSRHLPICPGGVLANLSCASDSMM